MPIRHKTIIASSPLRQFGRRVKLWFPANQNAYLLGSTTSTSMVAVGTALTMIDSGAASAYTRGLTSIAFTPGGAPASAFTFTVIGYDQFNQLQNETVTTGTSANIVHTTFCYSKIVSITPTAKSSTGGDAISIGWTGVVTSGTPRVALTFRPTATGSIQNMTLTLGTGTLPTFTAELAKYTVAVSAQPLFPATVGGYIDCTVDPEDPTL